LLKAFVQFAHFLMMPFSLMMVHLMVKVVHHGGRGSHCSQDQGPQFQTQLNADRPDADRLHR
jgi:hypothetical protein